MSPMNQTSHITKTKASLAIVLATGIVTVIPLSRHEAGGHPVRGEGPAHPAQLHGQRHRLPAQGGRLVQGRQQDPLRLARLDHGED